jgi:DNA mismatch repair protein MutL
MITIVNGRVVFNQSVNRNIKDAYHTVLAENKFPIVVINIETDPTLIDVNIHPTKQDIKFSKLESLNDLLFETIRKAIVNTDNTFKPYKETPNYEYNNYDSNEYSINEKIFEKEDGINEVKEIKEVRLEFDSPNEVIYDEENLNKEKTLIKPVGLALGTYLIAHDEDTMYMFDIHASAERINYEKYLNNMEAAKIWTTNMLFPIQLEYSKKEFMEINENINIIKDMGFGVEEFGKNTFRIYSHPSWLKEGYEEESIKSIFDIVAEIKGDFDRVKFNDRVAATLACKASVKGNTSITYEEQEALINNLFKCKFPYTCPHGRPTVIKYPIYELEKMFKRVNFAKGMNNNE